jgi:APA family basic amino acid/polyamine antiporter
VRPFRAPLLPVIAGGGALACLYLITGLHAATWIRYAAWLAIGIVIYAFYGYRHSRLRKI